MIQGSFNYISYWVIGGTFGAIIGVVLAAVTNLSYGFDSDKIA
jgi:hypothetical protein